MTHPVIMSHHIPRARERLIVIEMITELVVLTARELHSRYPGSFEGEAAVFRAVFAGHLKGHTYTAQEIARKVGMPRTTVLRKLAVLTQMGLVNRRTDSRYCIAPERISRVSPALDRAIAMILKAAAQLRRSL